MEAQKGRSHRFRKSLSFRKMSKALTQHGRAKLNKHKESLKQRDSVSQNHGTLELDGSWTACKIDFEDFGGLKRNSSFRRSISSKLQYLPRLRKKFMDAAGTETKQLSGTTSKRNDSMNIYVRKIGLNTQKRKDFRKQIKRRFRSHGEFTDKHSYENNCWTDNDKVFESGNHVNEQLKEMNRSVRNKRCNSTGMRMKLKSRLTSLSEEVDFRDLIKPVAFHTRKIKVPKNITENQSELPSEITKGNSDKHRGDDGMNARGMVYKDNGVVAIAECTLSSQNVVSPTCADIYGQDEGSNLSFTLSHDSMASCDQTLPSGKEINLCLENVKGVLEREGTKIGKKEDKVDDLKRKDEHHSNVQCRTKKTKKDTKINQDTSGNSSYKKEEKVNTNHVDCGQEENNIDRIRCDFSDILKKENSLQLKNAVYQSDDINAGYDEVDNPWVLRTDILELSQKNQEPKLKSINFVSEYSVDDSIGFDVNQPDENLIDGYFKKREKGENGQMGRLVRLASVESVDSFSSSIHSAHSEDLFFSASEPEMEPDQISISSTESIPNNKPRCVLKIDDNNKQTPPYNKEADTLKTHNSKYKTDFSENEFDKSEKSSTLTPRKISSYLAGLKYFPFESSDKNKTIKHEKLKQRRSLDSNLKIQQMSLDLNMNESPALNSKLTSSTDSGLNSALSPVLEKHNKPMKTNRRRTVDIAGDQDNVRFFTLPARRKVKSEIQESPKRRATRISSISKMLSDKAQSLSNIKLGSSFKLRNNDAEKGKVPFLKATSLTNLMAKKGAEMASSISTLIRGRSNSNTVIDSPFKQNEKPKKTNNDDKVEIHYERVKVPCPRKRPVTSEEINAWKKRLTLDVALANSLSSSETMRLRADSVARKHHWSGSEKGSVRSPTLLDEIMKSVDNTRFRSHGSVPDYNFEDTDDEDSSNESTSVVFGNHVTVTSDPIPNIPFQDKLQLMVCNRCGYLKRTANNVSKQIESPVPSGQLSHSLCDLRKNCKCSNKISCMRPDNCKHENKYNFFVAGSEFGSTSPQSSELSEATSSTSSPKSTQSPEIKNSHRFSSMLELRDLKNESLACFEPGQGAADKDSLECLTVTYGSLLKHKPVLDLSADNLDMTDETDSGVVMYETERKSRERRSQSCDDITSCDKALASPDGEDFYSCTDVADTELQTGTHDTVTISPSTKSHSVDDILNETESILIDSGLKNDGKTCKKEVRQAKVKSLSSSHDALNMFVHAESLQIKLEHNGEKQDDNKVVSQVEESTEKELINPCLNFGSKPVLYERDLNDKAHATCDENLNVCDKTKLSCEDGRGEVKDAKNQCLSCKILMKDNVKNTVYVRNDAICNRSRTLSERMERVTTLSKKPPLPRKGQRKVLSVSDIKSQCDKNFTDSKIRNNRYSMIEMSAKESDINMSSKSKQNDDLGNKTLQKLAVKSQSCDFINTPNTLSSPIDNKSSVHKPSKFLFDEEYIQKYTLKPPDSHDKSIPIQKSVSSGNVPKELFDRQSSSNSTHSMFLLHRLSSQSYPDDVFQRLSSLSPPDSVVSPPDKLLTLDGFIEFSDTNADFPRFSDLPSLDGVPDTLGPEIDTILKYDVCLGYLLHSIQCDNKIICFYSFQRNKQLMESVITPLAVLPGVIQKRSHDSKHGNTAKQPSKAKCVDLPNPAAPITSVPSERLLHVGQVLRTVLLSRAPHMIRDRKFHLRTYRRCMVGTEMVDWLMQQCSLVHSRNQAIGMWQALVEEGVVVHVCHEHQFKDKYLFYRFQEDAEGVSTVPSNSLKRECEVELQEIFLLLAQIGPDAMMRMILRKLPHERTAEDLEIIYEELLHIKALSHLSTMVKRELASVLVFESHAKSGTVLFSQGDEGKSWYIILKGSVNVVIYGKGVVCTLHEGDDFGKLALVNDAPRAATIVLRDDNCHFLRVDKDDFNRILRDVEANTVRLKEHGQDVLVLEKIPSNTKSSDGSVHAHYKYSVMAGTPERMLEHLLESRLDNKKEDEIDGFLEDFILTHVIFMPCNHLCPVLLSHYHSSATETTEQEAFEFMFNHKKCVLHFVQEWGNIVGPAFKEDHTINAFLEELHSCVLDDLVSYPSLRDELFTLETVLQAQIQGDEGKSKKRASGNFTLSRKPSREMNHDQHYKRNTIKPTDENIFKVYCADHTYSTLKLSMNTTVENLLLNIQEKLSLGDDLILCEVKSSGEKIVFKENDLCVTSGLSINGRLFVTPREQLDALTPLPEQEGPTEGTFTTIEMFSSREMAYFMTLYDWELFTSLQEYELIYQVFGRYKFQKITANLDLFLRRFNEIQFWVVTEMVLTTNLSKRVTLLRKFIKLAAHCKEYKNLNSFFAVVMGLSNIAVSRLYQTWEKLPNKFKKMFNEFETLMDPSRNHRVYRLTVAKMTPPILPFMPLLMKDMTFTHEGNKTYFDGLVNFEKMRMISQTLKTVRFCRRANMDLETPSSTKSADAMSYIRKLHVIDNQKLLTQLSHKLEPRKT